MFVRFLIVFMSLIFGTSAANACDFVDSDGLDVGLVLSGGGAKSSTQVGVMQVMDELGIPIHCIAGTSMGAVVGSFYATGYSADEIAAIFTSEDWGSVFRGAIPREDKAFIQKEREETYFSGDILGFADGKTELPGGLNSMQGLKILYREILSDIPLNADFDKLGIPFRAVGTKLETGEAVAFKEGDLVESILVSMAVPGVFAPRVIDGVAYVDGGMSTNLPVKTIQDMGADIIIALDTTVPPRKSDGRYSVNETLQQLLTVTIYNNAMRDKDNLSEKDLYIRPNTIDLPTAGYARSTEGLAAGLEVGKQYRDAFLKIKALAAPAADRVSAYSEPLKLSSLTVENPTKIDDDVITSRFNENIEDLQQVDIRNRRLRELASFGGFGEADIGYRNGEAVLSVRENELGNDRLKVGINATSDFSGNSSYGLLAQYTQQPFGRRGGDLSASVEIGTDNGLSVELYQPFGAGSRFFMQPEAFIRSERIELDVAETRIGDFRLETLGARTRIGREISSWGLLAFEGEVKTGQVNDIVTIDDDFDGDKFSFGTAGVYFGVDTLDRTDWPTKGQRIQVRGQKFFDMSEGGALDSERFEASWLYAFQMADLGVLLNARYGKLDAEELIFGFDSTFELGGFRQLSAFRENSLPVDELTYGSVEIFKRLGEAGFLVDIPVYVGAIAEYGRIPLSFFEIDEVEDAYSGALYIGAETPVGPAFLGTAYGNSNDVKFFFRFGRTF